MARGPRSRRTPAGEEDAEKEYEVDVEPDRWKSSSRNSRLELIGRLPPLRRHSRIPGADGEGEGGFLRGLVIHPDNKYVSLPYILVHLPLLPYVSATTATSRD